MKRHPLITDDRIREYLAAPDDTILYRRSVAENPISGERRLGEIEISAAEFRRLALIVGHYADVKNPALKSLNQYHRVEIGLFPPPIPEEDTFYIFIRSLCDREPKLRQFPFSQEINEIAMIVLWMARTLIVD